MDIFYSSDLILYYKFQCIFTNISSEKCYSNLVLNQIIFVMLNGLFCNSLPKPFEGSFYISF